MPGRGQPWKKGGHVDETIDSGDIIDGTIKEVDLDSALQSKVNSAGGHEVLDEGISLAQRARIDFVGDGVTASDGIEDTTTVTIAGGGAHTIEDEGISLADQPTLNFTGTGVTATDTGGKTVVNIPATGDPTTPIEQTFKGGANLSVAVLEEEFIANANAQITNRFNLDGTLTASGGSRYGSVKVDTASATIGDIAQLDTDTSFRTLMEDSDFTYESVVRIDAWIQNKHFGFFGACADRFVNGISNIAQLLGQSTELAGFVADKSVSDNWRIVTQKGGVSTVVQTTIPVSTGFSSLKMEYDHTAQSIEFFAGETEGDPVTSGGTINTNVPLTTVGFCFLISNRLAEQPLPMTVDLLKVATQRDFGGA